MGGFVVAAVARDRLRVLADRVEAAYGEMRELSSDDVGNAFRLELAQRLEAQERTNRGLMYRLFGEMADPPDEAGMAPALVNNLAAQLRITPREVRRRMKTAALVRLRRQLSALPLRPQLALVAVALAAGVIGEDHLRVICRAVDVLPSNVSVTDRNDVEASLVAQATNSDAEIVAAVARRIDEIFNPDGDFDEADRARRRGLQMSAQGRDGMSRLSGCIDPETRAYIEALSAAVRPGRHLPDTTVVEARDDRNSAQRCHDGIKLGLKAAIASGSLRSHRGHPVTVIVRTTLAELNQAAHAVHNPQIPMPPPARTGGDTALPMRDVIRMGTEAIHYLFVFDDHSERPLYLGRQQRIATADQRIICYARDGGCTRPGCLAPGYHSEVHHSPDWSTGGATDADCLFFACAPDHTLITNGNYHTTVTSTGRLAWTDHTTPPQINHAHHPEELLHGNTDPPANDEK
ncbi:MAG: HNH endonuclease signature motif containing protein [Mycobacterium sp.]